jgi:hypothetical protein
LASPDIEFAVSIYVTIEIPDDDPTLRCSPTACSSPEAPYTTETAFVPELEAEKISQSTLSEINKKSSVRSTPVHEKLTHGLPFDPNMNDVSVYNGRPNVHEILENAVTTAEGPVSVDGMSLLCHIYMVNLMNSINSVWAGTPGLFCSHSALCSFRGTYVCTEGFGTRGSVECGRIHYVETSLERGSISVALFYRYVVLLV